MEPQVLKRGDKMYRVGGGEVPRLETVTFLERNVLPGCIGETIEFRDEDGRKFRTTIGYYKPSEREAWEAHLEDLKGAIQHIEHDKIRLTNSETYIKGLIAEVQTRLGECNG